MFEFEDDIEKSQIYSLEIVWYQIKVPLFSHKEVELKIWDMKDYIEFNNEIIANLGEHEKLSEDVY